jgi:hypothetical protein
MIDRFIESRMSKKILDDYDKKKFTTIMRRNMNRYNLTMHFKKEEEHEIDKILTKKIMILLQNFFL